MGFQLLILCTILSSATRSVWRNQFSLCFLTICLRLLHYRITLRTVPSDRDVRTRSTAFRVDLGTCYVTIYVVSRLLQEGVGEELYDEAHGARIVGGGVGKQ
jgi:hypothetical protein